MSSTPFVSPVDAAWLRMDRPTNPMMITALLQLEGRVPFEDVRRGIDERLVSNVRFRQRVVRSRVPFLPPRWTEDARFEIGAHVHRATLPSPGDEGALRNLVSDLMSTPFDRTRPLWDMHVVVDAPGGTAIVARVHHAVGDGVALVRVLLGASDRDDGGGGKRDVSDASARASRGPARVGVTRARASGLRAKTARAGAELATLVHLLTLPADAPSALKGDLGTRKRAAWSRPIPLARVYDVAHATGGKVNDVLLAAAFGAARTYLGAGDERAGTQALRALVPVYVRGDAEARDGAQAQGLGNHFGLVFVDLPAAGDPLSRVRRAKATMDALKQAPDALVAMKVLGALGMASKTIERIGVDLFTGKASMLVTNVPGPPARVRLFGGRLATIVVWAPVSGSVGVGITLVSYAGEVRMGVSADVRRLGAPEALVTAFEADFAAIERAALGADP
jgi:diacylglycerol O-acyltransferase